MVAYSFQPRFVDPILTGTKTQTIRAIGRRRHVVPGELLQLYRGMRTKHCKLIIQAQCASVRRIELDFVRERYRIEGGPWRPISRIFAETDGFASVDDMMQFWHKHHRGVEMFRGVIITW